MKQHICRSAAVQGEPGDLADLSKLDEVILSLASETSSEDDNADPHL